MPFACIFVPNFPVAAVFRAEPELRAQAVAIFEGKPPLEKLSAVNESAGRLGIAPGMTRAQAELCSELTLRQRSRLQESVAHAALLDCAQSFSPCVEDAAADTAILDLAGMESLFGSLPEIARNLFRRAAELGLDGNVAVASNPDAAILAARGFSGVTVIPPGKESETLGSLSVEVLFANGCEGKKKEDEEQKESARLLATLDRWGVRNLRALAALPEVALSERLGQEGLRLQQLARGTASRTLVPVEAPAIFEEAIELEYPIVLLEPLAFLLNRLLEQICVRLASRALNTQQLRLTLELQNLAGADPQLDTCGIPSESDASQDASQKAVQHFISGRQSKFCRTLSLPLPMLDPKLFLKLLQLDLNAHPPGAPILKIHLAAEPARPRSAQGGLFLPPSPEPEKLELTLARIAGLIGESRLGSLELLDTHRAEGFRMRRFVPEAVQEKRSPKISEPLEEKSAVTALRIFRPPLRATVTLENGQLMRVVCAKKKEVQGNVLWKAGPWRSSGDWWEREAWSRDEWDIALQNAEGIALFRLVHDLLGGGWFVEGTYD
ncbi:MAG: DNA polymerase Y family protein [Candidatus Sulfotelmatobacter sp.]